MAHLKNENLYKYHLHRWSNVTILQKTMLSLHFKTVLYRDVNGSI